MEGKIGMHRWIICSLVFFATTINYLDRAVISLLKNTLTEELHWDEVDYGNIVIAFQLSYAFGLLGAGRLIDQLGSRYGYGLATFLWSIAAVGHAFAKSTFGFGLARAFLGITEAGNFPAAIKVIAEWFPKKERALATGIFNSGANIGAIVAPLTVPFIAVTFGWKWAFIATGSLGFIWLLLWFRFFQLPQLHKKVSKEELAYIESDNNDKLYPTVLDPETEKTSWIKLLGFNQTWAFALGKFLTDPVWWFYLFWLPDFLNKEYHLEGTDIGFPLALVYTMSVLGSILGGWIPMKLINNKWDVFNARRASMLIYALCALPVIFAQYLGSTNMWFSVLIIGFAAASHQAWSANIFSMVSDMFPKKVVASVTGIGGMFGALGGVLIAVIAPQLFEYYKTQGNVQYGYFILFFICGLAYLSAWIIIRLLVPRVKMVKI